MTVRRILTVALLLFVAASVVAAVGKELRGRSAAVPSTGISGGSSARGGRLVACYFLGKVRCSSCRKIEAVSRKAVEGGFPREVADGRLRFLPVNVDLPENRHFIEEFRLEGSSLVLVELRDGKTAGWKPLPDVWTLVDNEARLDRYVREEVAAGLKRI